MRWYSIDPATKTGIAVWEGDQLEMVGTVRPAKAKEAKQADVPRADALTVDWRNTETRWTFTARNRMHFWRFLLADGPTVVAEEAMGFSPKAVAQLGFRRGYVAAIVEVAFGTLIEVNSSEWRRVAREAYGVSFPNNSEAAKALAVSLVHEQFGLECSDDEADAVLVGVWALRTQAVRP